MTSSDGSQRTSFVFWTTLALVGLAMGVLLILLPFAGSERRWTIHWLPGAGPMDVGLGETGFYAALVTVGACLLALAAARAEMTLATSALTLLALLGGAVAFLAEHFLLRYVALEIVALCVALAPLAERRESADEAERGRWARLVYLALRLGDAGLLVGILALWSATGTLDISPSLEAGMALSPAILRWIVAGLLLAVWVKVGGWPLHVWQQAGKGLSLFSRSWLYRTLTPNLGFYLLYRVTPLIAKTPIIQIGALWVGALLSVWAAIRALGGPLVDGDRALSDRYDQQAVYVYAAQGGLALVLAAIGLKTTVWLTVIVLTLLRMLLFLAGESAQEALQSKGRQAAAALYGWGGLALSAFNVLCLWWAREAGLPLGVRLVAEGVVGLIAAWALVTTLALWRGSRTERVRVPPSVRRWVVLCGLAAGLLAAVLWRTPLLDHLAFVSRGPPFALPPLTDGLRFLATSPTGWAAFVLTLWAQRLVRRGARLPGMSRLGQESDPALALEQGIRRFARAVHAIVEAGASQGALTGLTRGVMGAAHLSHRWIEGVFLEGATRQIARTAIDGGRLTHRWIEGEFQDGTTRQIVQTATESGRLAHRVMELGGLEGLLRRMVRAVMAGSRWLQRRHTGRLRRNLVWVAASLGLAALGLILYVW